MIQPSSDLVATGAHVGKNGVNSFLVDGPHTLGGYTKPDPTIFTFHPKTVAVKVGKKTPLALDIGVRYDDDQTGFE